MKKLLLLLSLAYSINSSAQSIAAGGAHSFVICDNDSLQSWGFNGNGQLGNGNTNNSLVPVSFGPLTDIVSIAGGNTFSFALKSDGNVWAWGYNGNGEFGDGNNADSNVPVQVTNVPNVTAIAAGNVHTLKLKKR